MIQIWHRNQIQEQKQNSRSKFDIEKGKYRNKFGTETKLKKKKVKNKLSHIRHQSIFSTKAKLKKQKNLVN